MKDEGERVWRKSTRCDSGTCVEVALTAEVVGMRNSNEPKKELEFTRRAWNAFVEGLKAGEFDNLH